MLLHHCLSVRRKQMQLKVDYKCRFLFIYVASDLGRYICFVHILLLCNEKCIFYFKCIFFLLHQGVECLYGFIGHLLILQIGT